MTEYEPGAVVLGDLLIAPPNRLAEPFNRTVVLICMHDVDVSLGW